MSSNKQRFATTEEVQEYVPLLFGMRCNIDKAQAEYNKLFKHLQSMVGFLPKSDNNDFPLYSSLFNS
jgi:hypothetical protein